MQEGLWNGVRNSLAGAKVIRLDSRRGGEGSAGVSFPAIAQVEAYWEALRAGRAMPERAEIDPRGLEAALGHAFLAQPVAPGVIRFRLAGRQICDLMGMEVRGMPLSALIRPDARDALARVIAALEAGPGAALLDLDSDRGTGRPPLDARLFLAPLSEAGAPARRFLGCLEARGAIGRTPRRFTIASVSIRRTGASARASLPDLPAQADPRRAPADAPAIPGMADGAAVFRHATGARRGHLRLVRSSD
ncbi:PAS domain-containing protein [Meinhardsimonia xiamenensis]|jgi:hypothetical protein|uniref:PAS domain-containing protein n=1 Tax=Meinhardsimonia xiamenensis TaxID=990712 RepID=A0A1G9H421_9RHOB|nr:PAS domain-containing protein [Meinhardsimonia xiamenensis]PRX29777.1 PAS domain-containing protein [Meinhardsimonia xiamenensis]SDL07554.1 PAS domain-containing protein [Meinhardsimonia xiamenensis]